MITYKEYLEGADFLKSKIGDFKPKHLLVLGSGLNSIAETFENPVIIDYKEVPHMPVSTAPDHKGRFVFGYLENVPVMVMQGRIHYYEGYEPWQLTYPIRLAKLLGVENLILTNAVGAINENIKPGELILITDVIKFACPNPLRGQNIPEFGPRFNDMTNIFTKEYRQIAKECAKELNIPIHEGVYMYTQGPQFETPAEIRAFRILGADIVGMSTVPESIVAAHCNMKILGIAFASNMAAGILDREISVQEINENCEKAVDSYHKLLLSVIPKL